VALSMASFVNGLSGPVCLALCEEIAAPAPKVVISSACAFASHAAGAVSLLVLCCGPVGPRGPVGCLLMPFAVALSLEMLYLVLAAPPRSSSESDAAGLSLHRFSP